MSGDRALEIPDEILRSAYAEARAAFPAECCGWLVGPKDGDAVTAIRPCENQQAGGEHPTVADRTAETAYVIAGDELLELVRSLDTDVPARIIYHSHPNGRAYFSATDAEVAMSPWGDGPAYPVQQLVVGIDGERVTGAALFSWSDDAVGFVEIARFEGAEI